MRGKLTLVRRPFGRRASDASFYQALKATLAHLAALCNRLRGQAPPSTAARASARRLIPEYRDVDDAKGPPLSWRVLRRGERYR